MTNPLITALHSITKQEASMTDEAQDHLEGYCDGMSDHPMQMFRSREYNGGYFDGADDDLMLTYVTEWKRRAAMPAA
jgi:hypothetical protein